LDTSNRPKAFDVETAKYYDIEAPPTNFLPGKEGKILAVDLAPKEIEKKIKKLIY